MNSVTLDLPSAIATALKAIVSSRLHGTAIVQRARCVLLAYEKRKYTEISRMLGLSAKAVGRWVSRFRDSIDALTHIQNSGVKAALLRQILDCLRDAPRTGRPKKFSPGQVASIISIACEAPEASNRPVTSWTVITSEKGRNLRVLVLAWAVQSLGLWEIRVCAAFLPN